MKDQKVEVQIRAVDSDDQLSAENDQPVQAEPWASEDLSPIQEVIFVSVLMMAQFFAQAGMGQVTCILPVISSAFHITNPGELSWLIAGYSLTVGTFILLSGRLGDYFGHKRIFLAGVIWFAFCSVLSGLSVYVSQYLFILSRVLCGIGPSICIPTALAILGRAYPPGVKKNIIFSLYGGLSPIGSVLASIISAVFAEYAWWPWSFWVMGILAAITALGGFLAIPSSPSQYSSLKTKPTLKEILWATDIPAGALGITALVFFNLAWNQAVVATWAAPYITVFLVLGIVIAVAFFYVEIKISPAPLIPFHILTGDVAFVLGCVAAAWGGFGTYIYYMWSTVLFLDGTPPIEGALWFITPIPVGFGAAILTGYLMAKVHPAMLMVMVELCVLTCCLLLATKPPGQTYWAQIFPSLIFAPLGLDMSFPAAILILSNAVGRENQGMAMSLVNTIVNYSISISLGVAGTIEQQVAKHIPEGPEKVLLGYRSAEYFSCAIVASGLLVSVVFLWTASRRGGLKASKELGDIEAT